MSEQPLYTFKNPWFSASVGITVVLAVLSALAGLIWLPLAQPDLRLGGIWDAINGLRLHRSCGRRPRTSHVHRPSVAASSNRFF